MARCIIKHTPREERARIIKASGTPRIFPNHAAATNYARNHHLTGWFGTIKLIDVDENDKPITDPKDNE
jgi:hypothetical protein